MKPGLRILGASALDAVGTTVPMILPTVASATARYARLGLIDWRAVRWATPGGVLGAIAGSLAAPRVPGAGHLLQIATAGLMLVTAARMLARARSERSRTRPGSKEPPAALAPDAASNPTGGLVAVGTLSGVLSGLLGVGGGVLMVPGFNQALGMPLRIAIATSLVCAGAFAIPATITHSFLGTVDWRFAVLLIAGAIPGARVGATMSIRASDRRLQLLVGVLLSIVAVSYAVAEIVALGNAE